MPRPRRIAKTCWRDGWLMLSASAWNASGTGRPRGSRSTGGFEHAFIYEIRGVPLRRLKARNLSERACRSFDAQKLHSITQGAWFESQHSRRTLRTLDGAPAVFKNPFDVVTRYFVELICRGRRSI